MSYKEKKYCVLRNVMHVELCEFLYAYLKNRKAATEILIKKNIISPYDFLFGSFGDYQIPDTFAIYGDATMDTLLSFLKNIVEAQTELKLVETYSYSRLYKTGDELVRHKDRKSCEVSGTLNLGGDPWPIFLQPDIKIRLNPGDMLIYSGCDLEHWREKFEGECCGQVFLHYNREDDKSNNKYDGRVALGLPNYVKNG